MSMDAEQIRRVLHQAVELQKSLRLTEAAALYRRVLANDPHNADATHLLGMVLLSRGQVAEACETIGAAIALNPREPAFRSNLAIALKMSGQREEVEAQLRNLLAEHP